MYADLGLMRKNAFILRLLISAILPHLSSESFQPSQLKKSLRMYLSCMISVMNLNHFLKQRSMDKATGLPCKYSFEIGFESRRKFE